MMAATLVGISWSATENLASASSLAACDGTVTNGLAVSPGHGQVLYIDSGAGLDAGYAGYQVTNSSGADKTNLWVQVDAFTGGVIALANPLDARQQIADLPNGESKTAFYLMRATNPTQTPQEHRVRVFDRDPQLAGAQELYSCSYTFVQVRETIKAAANKVCEVKPSTTSPILGGTLTLTVIGLTGTIGSGSAPDGKVAWFSPAAFSSWPTRSLRLESTLIELGDFAKTNCSTAGTKGTVDLSRGNQLLFDSTELAATSKSSYRATYTFRVIGRSASSVSPAPIAQISSGTQVKHTDLSGLTDQTNPPLATNTVATDLSIAKTVVSTTSLATQNINGVTHAEVPYRLTVSTTSSSAVTVDSITDIADDSMIWLNDTASVTDLLGTRTVSVGQLNGAPPGEKERVVTGPFSVSSSRSAVVDYTMLVPLSDGTYTNTAYALSGETKVGSSASLAPRTTVTVSGGGVTGAANSTVALEPDVSTEAATSITTTTATINALVNAQGISTDVDFEWGTSPTLTNATITPIAETSGSTSPASVSSNLTGLVEGTTYYYRARATTGGQTYLGAILSFTTGQTQSPPTAETTAPTNVTTSTATLNGLIDPNLTPTTVRFEYRVQGEPNWESSGTLQEVVDEEKNTLGDVTLSGVFPSAVSFDMTSVSAGTTYEYRVVAETGPVEGTTVTFRAGTPQTITFASIASQDLSTGSLTVTPTSSSSLPVTVTSADTSVCSVSSSPPQWTVTLAAAGTCILTASQEGDGTYASADPITRVFTIAAPVSITTSSLPGGTTNASYGPETLAAAGGSGTYTAWAVTAGTLPSGITLDSATGVLSGTPTTAGSSTVTIEVTDSDGATTNKQFTIDVFAPVSITTTNVAGGADGVSYGPEALSATGGSGTYTAWTITSGSLPPGLALDSVNGQITGTPTSAGPYTFTVQVTDSQGRTATQQLTIVVTGPLAISTASPLPSGVAGIAYSQIFAAGGGTPSYTNWRVATGALPGGLAVDSSTGVLSGTPTLDGTFTFTIEVDDSATPTAATASKSFTLVIEPQPVATTVEPQVVAGGKIRLKGRVNAKGAQTDARFEYWPKSDSSAVTQTAVSVISGSSDTDIDIDVTGLALDTEYEYRVKASNNRGNKLGQTLTFRTPARPTAAIGASDILSVTETTARIRGRVNAKRGLGPARVTVTRQVAPSTVRARSSVMAASSQTMSASSVISAATDPCTSDVTVDGETDENLECDLTGLDPATTYDVAVTIDNGFDTDTATYSFTTLTSATALSITTTSPLASGTVASAYSTTFAATGGSGTYSTWRVIAGSLPGGLTLNQGTGVLSGTPTVDGTFTFTLEVEDSAAATATKAFSVTIAAANAPNPNPGPNPPTPGPTPTPGDEEKQTLTFAPIADQPLSIIPVVALVSSNSPTAIITVTSTTPNVCRVTGTTIQMLAVGVCTLTATSPAHDGFTAADPITRSFRITTPPTDVVDDPQSEDKTVTTTPGSTVGVPIPPTTEVEVTEPVKYVASIEVKDGILWVTPIEQWTGILMIPVRLTSEDTTITMTLRVTVSPKDVSRATFEPTSVKRTIVRWQAVKQGPVRYIVSVNGKTVCRTAKTSCAAKRLVGPKSSVAITVQGGDGTRSSIVEARYAPRKPVWTTVIYFGFDSSALTRDSRRSLNKLARIIAREGFPTLRAEGHTDGIGSQTYNLALSQRRIDAAVRYLSRKFEGLDVDTRALGKLVAAATNATAEGRALNRRVEFYVR